MGTQTEGSSASVIQREVRRWEQQAEIDLGLDDMEHPFGFKLFITVSDLKHKDGFLMTATV